jgi:hypothetical protein
MPASLKDSLIASFDLCFFGMLDQPRNLEANKLFVPSKGLGFLKRLLVGRRRVSETLQGAV